MNPKLLMKTKSPLLLRRQGFPTAVPSPSIPRLTLGCRMQPVSGHSQDTCRKHSHALLKRIWKAAWVQGLVQVPSRANMWALSHPRRAPKPPQQRLWAKLGGGGADLPFTTVARIGLIEKVTFEQRPKGAVRASKPRGRPKKEMPERRAHQGTAWPH